MPRFRHSIAARRSWFLPIAAGIGTFASVYVIDAVLARFGLRADATLVDDLLLALVVGVLVLSLELQHRRELRRQAAKLALIGEMNHHIRNALQVILGSTIHTLDPAVAEKIRESTRRIEWALREILPADEVKKPVPYRPATPWKAAGRESQQQSPGGAGESPQRH